jgi:NAD(P)-dependent dehydrogenase (short-subunit alcohol dehydrogenase family)
LKIGPGTAAAITGASSGIGQELAFQMAARGCAVALAARRADVIEANAQKIRASGGRAIAVATDVSRRPDVETFMRRAFDEFGRLDVVVNNAGIAPATGTLLENSEEAFRRTMEVNLMGGVYGVWASAPLMERSGGGTMVFVSSIMGKRGAPRSAAYCASKFAVQGLTESIRPELARMKIHVLTVCPPGVDTPFFDVNGKPGRRRYRLHPVSKIARHIIHAIETGKRETLPTLDAKAVHWANVFFPKLVDRLAVKVKGEPL